MGGEDGVYSVGTTIIIRQSFHMKKTAGNEYQSDKCAFNEEFMVLQVNDDTTAINNICIPDPREAENGGVGCLLPA